MNYLIYTRVSERGSDWTGTTSCEAQAEECRRHVLALDKLATFEELREEFVSGTSLKKRLLAHVLDDAAAGRAQWDVLVALDLDRLFRSTEECLAAFRALAAAQKGCILVKQNIDLASPYGRFTLTILAAVAELLAKVGAQKTRDKMRHMAMQGEWPVGICPMGYRRIKPRDKNNPKAVNDNHLMIDEATAPTVRAMFAAAAAGEGPVAIARRHKLPKNTVNKILRNRMYLGTLIYADIEVTGAFPALVDAETWQRAQPAPVRPGQSRPRPTTQTHAYLLAGRIRCQCGAAMSPANCSGQTKRYPYYRCQVASCTSPARYVRADQLDDAVLAAIADSAYNPKTLDRLAAFVASQSASLVESAEPKLVKLRKAQHEAQRAIDRLVESLHGADTAKLLGARSAILVKLETKQRDMDDVSKEIARIERETVGARATQDAAAVASMWGKFARDVVTSEDVKHRRDWMAVHVDLVQSVRDGWSVKCKCLTDLGKSSTIGPLWHPSGFHVELFVRIPSRRAA